MDKLKPKIYYATIGTLATLIIAKTEAGARKEAMRKAGDYGDVRTVRLATGDDIDWICAMGGRVPEILGENGGG